MLAAVSSAVFSAAADASHIIRAVARSYATSTPPVSLVTLVQVRTAACAHRRSVYRPLPQAAAASHAQSLWSAAPTRVAYPHSPRGCPLDAQLQPRPPARAGPPLLLPHAPAPLPLHGLCLLRRLPRCLHAKQRTAWTSRPAALAAMAAASPAAAAAAPHAPGGEAVAVAVARAAIAPHSAPGRRIRRSLPNPSPAAARSTQAAIAT